MRTSGFLLLLCWGQRYFLSRLFHQFVAGLQHIAVHVILTQAVDAVVRRFQMRVRDQRDADFQARFDAVDIGALLVQQEGGYIHRNLYVYRCAAFFHRLFLDDAQDMQGGRFDATDVADATATWAGHVVAFAQAGRQPLP